MPDVQSGRRARDAGNPTATDNVCLNEIEYAQRACKIPIVPVQVVSCEAPFLIYRLHQINFRRWRESEATYQAGLNQICAAIAEVLQSRKSPERPWMPSLEGDESPVRSVALQSGAARVMRLYQFVIRLKHDPVEPEGNLVR